MPVDAHGNHYGHVHWLAYNPDGERVTVGSTTSMAPSKECSIMSSFLEIERAGRLRGVDYPPLAVGGAIVVSPHASLWKILRGWRAARRRALAQRPS